MSATAAAAKKGRSPVLFSLLSLGVTPSRGVIIGLQIASLLVPLLAWTTLASMGVVDEKFLPSPGAVLRSLASMAESGILFQDILASTGRVFAGFLLATFLAIPIGICMGVYPAVCALCEPLIAMLRYMPAAAFIPLLIIYLGIGEEPKIALIFLGTVYFNILMVMDAVKFVPKELIETTLTLGGRSRQVLVQVVARSGEAANGGAPTIGAHAHRWGTRGDIVDHSYSVIY